MAHKIELYGVIGLDYWGVTAASLVKQLRKIEDDDDQDIELHINSGGGYVDDAVAMFNRLKAHPGNVAVHIDALAASAATIVALAGDSITMPKNASLMIHQPWGVAVGTADDMRKSAGLLDKTENSMVAMYADFTGMDEDEIRDLLAAETWMDADEALSRGFVTAIDGESADVQAQRDEAVQMYAYALDQEEGLTAYKNPPAWAQVENKPQAPLRAVASTQTESQDMADKTKAAAGQKVPAVEEKQAPPIDIEAVKAAALAADRKRASEIRAAGRKLAVADEVIESLVDQGTPVLEAKAAMSDWLAARPTVASSLSVNVDAADKKADGIRAALELRAGLLSGDEAAAARRGNPYVGKKLSAIAETFDAHNGLGGEDATFQRVFASSRELFSPRADIGITHTTSDFPTLLADVMHKSMLRGWEEIGSTHEAWTNRGSLNDFRPASRTGLNLFPDLLEVGEGDEYKGATINERGVSIELATFGRTIAVTRQMLINDDMQALSEMPRKMGRAARRTISKAVTATLTGNPNFADGIPLFDALHDNTTGGLSLDAAGVSTLTEAMRLQTDPDGISVLDIQPTYLLVPAALEFEARQLMQATMINNTSNIMQGALQIIVDPRLDASSGTTFYVIASNMYDTIEVAYLNGVDAPRLQQMDGWRVDGTEFKVGIDFGIGIRDFRSFQRGTA